jgi:predicted oxidoreductase
MKIRMSSSTPILGSMRFGDWGARLSPVQVADLLEAALDLGIDTLDLADIYGGHTTNALVGAAFALRPGLRARFRLIAKIGIVMISSPNNPRGVPYYDLSVEHLQHALSETLIALDSDHVDTLMLHRFDPHLEPAGIADWIRDKQRVGHVGDFGVSNLDAHAIALFDSHLPVVANQIELSLANSTVLDDGTHNATRARGAEIQAWSPLGGGDLLNPQSQIGGRLHDRLQAVAGEFSLDPASLLLRWVASLPATRVVLGSTKIERLRDAVRACAEPLPRDAWYALWEAARGKAVP